MDFSISSGVSLSLNLAWRLIEVNSIYLQTLVKKIGQRRGYHFVIQSPIFKDKIKKEKLLFLPWMN
jgi:hypothetical protein